MGGMGKSEEEVTGALTVPSALTDWLGKAREQTNGCLYYLYCYLRGAREEFENRRATQSPLGSPWQLLLGEKSLSICPSGRISDAPHWRPNSQHTQRYPGQVCGVSGLRQHPEWSTRPGEQVRLVDRGTPRRAFSSHREACWLCCLFKWPKHSTEMNANKQG